MENKSMDRMNTGIVTRAAGVVAMAMLILCGSCGAERDLVLEEENPSIQAPWTDKGRLFPGEGPELAMTASSSAIGQSGSETDRGAEISLSEPETILVPYDYSTITEAVANAGPGDTIEVYAAGSPYDDSVETFPITITQDNLTLYSPDGATVTSNDPNANIILVGTYSPSFTGTSGVTIDGFEILTSRNGILAMATAEDPSDSLTIRNCTMEYIGPPDAQRCMFGTYCYLQIGADYGNLLIENLSIPYCERGICMTSGGYGVFEGASIQKSEIHAVVDGIVVIGQNGVDFPPATTNIDIGGNLVTRKHLWSVAGAWGVALFSVSGATIHDNIIQEFEHGIQLGAPNSRDSVLEDNKFHKNDISVGLYGSDDNLVMDNIFTRARLADVDMSNVCPYNQCYNAPEDLPVTGNLFVSNSPWKADYLKGRLLIDNWENGILVEPPIANAGNLFFQKPPP